MPVAFRDVPKTELPYAFWLLVSSRIGGEKCVRLGLTARSAHFLRADSALGGYSWRKIGLTEESASIIIFSIRVSH